MMYRMDRLLVTGMLVAGILIVPAMAYANITLMDDGRTHYSNGTYWITWDPIGDHTVGDRFFINATTNLSPGTIIGYDFYDPDVMCHTKICSEESLPGTGGSVTVGKGPVPGINGISILIDSSGFHSTTPPDSPAGYRSHLYLFMYEVDSAATPAEMGSFGSPGYVVKPFISLYPVSPVVSPASPSSIRPAALPVAPDTIASPPVVAGICGVIFVSAIIVLSVIRRGGKKQ